MAANADLSTAWNLIVWATASRALPERAEGASNSFPRGARSLFFACSQLNESGMVNATPNSPPLPPSVGLSFPTDTMGCDIGRN